MSDKALIKTDDVPDLSIGEFGSRRDIAALSNRIRAMMPGGENLTANEAMATAQYALTLGANPFRGEIYAYKDKGKGKLNIVEGYKLLVRWAKRQCDYSEWYTAMDGLPNGATGFWCHILRQDKHGLLETLLKGGMEMDQAMDIVTTTAGGVVRGGDGTSVPKGWTIEDVAKKRALKNALNKSHGVPSLQEIADMSWKVNGHDTEPEDWQDVTSDMSPDEAAAEAEYNAKRRETKEHPTVENAVDAVGDLFGDDAAEEYEDAIAAEVEGNGFVDAEFDEPPMPEDHDDEPHKWTTEESDTLFIWGRERGLSGNQIVGYLSVARISQYPGNVAAAKAKVEAQIALEQAAEAAQPEAEGVEA